MRIFPLYYAVIALFAIAKARGWLRGGLEGLPYAATYTYNLWFSTRATQFSMLLTHFWSLCVEEQFYLLWPLLIYVTPRARLKPLLTSLIAAGPAIRLLGACTSSARARVTCLTRSSAYTASRRRSWMRSLPAV